MPNHNLDVLILELKAAENAAATINETVANLRKEIFGIVENEGLTEGYKNDYATISYVTRQKIDIVDPEKLLKDLEAQKLVKYYQTIPEHKEFTPKLMKDIKDGTLSHEAIKVETNNNLAIRYNK